LPLFAEEKMIVKDGTWSKNEGKKVIREEIGQEKRSVKENLPLCAEEVKT